MDLEADADIENGWERFDPEQVTPQVDNAIVRRRSRNMKVNNEEDAISGSTAHPN
jgi:hypothetical protein